MCSNSIEINEFTTVLTIITIIALFETGQIWQHVALCVYHSETLSNELNGLPLDSRIG